MTDIGIIWKCWAVSVGNQLSGIVSHQIISVEGPSSFSFSCCWPSNLSLAESYLACRRMPMLC